MRRGSEISEASGAFELFLDTITNTFGGVVFISLLVCILLQIRGETDRAMSEEDIARARALEVELKAVRGEIVRLEGLEHRMQGQIETTSDRVDSDLARDYDALLKEKHALEATIARLNTETPLEDKATAELERTLAELKSEQDSLSKHVAGLEAELKRTEQSKTHRIRLPQYRVTAKQQVPLVVFRQRMYWPTLYDNKGNPIARNSQDFTISEELAGDTVVIPKPGRGTPVDNTEAFRVELRRRLAQFDKHSTYIHLVVWPDSYPQAEIVRDAVISIDFGYGLMLMESGALLTFSTHGERGEM